MDNMMTNGSHEKMLVINMIEKYVSVVTALARVKWVGDRDYRGVEALMGEACEIVEGSIEKVSSGDLIGNGARDNIVNKLIMVIKVNQAHAVYM